MSGKLYLCATPIGNLEDMPTLVAATICDSDLIDAEKTRVTMKQLNKQWLKKPIDSYY